MKTLKKILCTLLVVVICLTAAPLDGFIGIEWPEINIGEWFGSKASALSELATSGQCGDDAYWDLNVTTGELIISGSGAMYDYSGGGNPFYYFVNYIKSIVIKKGITSIGNSAFSGCQYLKNIVIPNSVVSIGNSAFNSCKNIKEINIPVGIKTIGYSAFEDCDSLTNITIPYTVTSIGEYAFDYCNKLTRIDVDNSNKNYSSDKYGVLFNKEFTTLIQFPDGNLQKTYSIPNGVTTIGRQAFEGSENLEKITIPKSVTTIYDWAFHSKYITKITVDKNNSNYSSDEYGVLFNKDKTKLIRYPVGNIRSFYSIPNSVTYLFGGAFEYCDNIISITIPTSVKTINWYAFSSCKNLKNVYYLGNETQWKNINIGSPSGNLTSATIHYNYKPSKYYPEPTASYNMNNLKTGDTILLSAIKETDGKKERMYGVSWYTTNQAVATVTSAGLVTIKDKGFAQIYFKYADKESTTIPIISNGYIVTEDFNIVDKKPDSMPSIDVAGQQILDKTGFNIEEILSNISLEGGKLKGPTVDIMGQEVTLFEFDVGAEFPLLDETTIIVDRREKKIKIGIGIKEENAAQVGKAGQKTTYWSESYKEVKNLYQKATGKKVTTTKLWNDFSALRGRLKKMNGKMALNCDTYLAGYLEFSYSGRSYEFLEGGVLAECNFGATVESRWPSFPAAYTVFGVTAGAHGDLMVEVKEYKSSYAGNIGGVLKASYGVGLGEKKVSDTYIEGGMEATLNVNFAFPASSLKDSLTVGMTGDFYVTAMGIGYELYSDVFPFTDFQLYPTFQQNRRMMMLRSVSATELEKTATPIDRDYTTDESKIDIAEDTFKKSDLYAFNAPTLVQLGNNKQMLVWVDDDGTKSAINRTTLYYSIFNGSAWSMPDIVFESKGYNGTPVVVSDGTNVHILWSMSPEMSAADGYAELVKSLDLFYIKYNGSMFEEPIQITTDNDIQEFSYDMTLIGSDVYITWIENTDNNSMMGTGINSLKTVNIENGVLSDINTIIETSDFITGTTMLAEDELSYYVITENESGSKLLEFKEGIETELRNIPERMSQLDTFNNLITFVEDSRLIKYNGETFYAFNMDNVDNYEFVTNGTETAVITLVQGVNGSVKMMASYHNEEDNTWTSFVPLLDDGTYIRNYSPIMNSDGKILAAVNSVELNENQNADDRYGEATLFVLNGNNYFDLAIGEYLYKNKNEEGEDELLFEVTNLSSTTLESITVDIVDTAGGNATMDIPCELIAGETKEFSVIYEGLTSIGQKDVTVTVSNRAYVENNLVNNSITTTIGYADLAIENIIFGYDECNATIEFVIKNIGLEKAEQIDLSLFANEESNIILKNTLEKLEPNESKEMFCVIPNNLLSSGSEDVYNTLILSVTTDSIEADTANNEEIVGYFDFSELTDEWPNHEFSLVTYIEPTCTEEGSGAYVCLKCGYSEDIILYPTDHMDNYDYFDETPPTCKDPGYTWGVYCYDCETWFYGHEEIEKLPHTPLDAVEENRKAPQCETIGSYEMVVYCEVCETEISRSKMEIPATGHQNTVKGSQLDATCTEEGYTEGTYCLDCNSWTEGHTVISATGHSFSDGNSKCSNCDYDRADSCGCKCHKSGIAKIIFKIILIFQKIFKKNKECTCGVYHY